MRANPKGKTQKITEVLKTVAENNLLLPKLSLKTPQVNSMSIMMQSYTVSSVH